MRRTPGGGACEHCRQQFSIRFLHLRSQPRSQLLVLETSQNRPQRCVGKSHAAGQHLEQRQSEREHVAGRRGPQSCSLFGRHVGRRAPDSALLAGRRAVVVKRFAGFGDLGQAARCGRWPNIRMRARPGRSGCVLGTSQSEIQDLRSALAADEHIGRFQIAVNHMLGMGGGQARGDLRGEILRHVARQPLRDRSAPTSGHRGTPWRSAAARPLPPRHRPCKREGDSPWPPRGPPPARRRAIQIRCVSAPSRPPYVPAAGPKRRTRSQTCRRQASDGCGSGPEFARVAGHARHRSSRPRKSNSPGTALRSATHRAHAALRPGCGRRSDYAQPHTARCHRDR